MPMELLITQTLEALLFPPGILVVAMVLGVALLKRRRRTAMALLIFSPAALYVLSTPFVAISLMQLTQTYQALTPESLRAYGAQAIVLLSAGRNTAAPEFGYRDTASEVTLERTRYAAYLHHRTGLPVVASGGSPHGEQDSLGALMAASLREDFAVGEVWIEGRSRTTQENAVYSAELLREKGIKRVFVVSHAWHLKRAVPAFIKSGLEVIPAPTAFETLDTRQGFLLVLPHASALRVTAAALHELLGIAWYKLRHA